MFTGIIQAIGQIERVTPVGPDLKLKVEAANLGLSDVTVGDSIAVNGVCLTAETLDATHFTVHVSRETLGCTVGLDSVRAVNLEKALRFSDRLGGHLVSGHVDGIGQVVRLEPVGDCILLSVRAPHALARYIAVKGSVAVDGVSLTVNALPRPGVLQLSVIDHTVRHTTLGALRPGDGVHLEADVLAKHLKRLAAPLLNT